MTITKVTEFNNEMYRQLLINNVDKRHDALRIEELKIREDMKIHGIRHIPLTKDQLLYGMISDRDLLKFETSGTFSYLKAEDVMTTVLFVAEEDTPLAHIARVLLEEKISALPIINKDHKLVGMISRTDILKAVVYNRLVLK